MRNSISLLQRFLGKLVHDILPAALASLIGGFLLSHYGLGRAPQAPVVAAAPASTEMMQMLDDEHALVAKYLKAQLANEKRLLETEDSAPREVAEPRSVMATTPLPTATVVAAAKTSPRGKPGVVGASLPPLVLAQAPQAALPSAQIPAPGAANAAARDDGTLLAKTIGIKDRVVSATQRAVSALTSIPAWFGTIGERNGGEQQEVVPRPPADLVRAS